MIKVVNEQSEGHRATAQRPMNSPTIASFGRKVKATALPRKGR